MRPTAEGFHSFLRETNDTDIEDQIDFESIVTPTLLSTLGYSQDNIFYEVTLSDKESLTYADAIVAKESNTPPWLLVETRFYPDSDSHPPGDTVDSFVYEDLNYYHRLSGAEKSILLTNHSIGYYDGEEATGHLLSDISKEQAAEIYNEIKPPSDFPTAPTSAGRRTKERIEGRNFSINKPEFRSKIASVRNADTNNEKKESLESLCSFLIEGVDDFRVRDKNRRTRSSEIDIIVENTETNSPLNSDSKYILIECRNWKDPIGAKHIRDFVGKVKSANSNFGIIFTKEGITGTDEAKDALGVVKRAFDSEGVLLITFTLRDLESILNNHLSFYDILEEKIFNRRFPK